MYAGMHKLCVCVCVRERERKRERAFEHECAHACGGQRATSVAASVSSSCVFSLLRQGFTLNLSEAGLEFIETHLLLPPKYWD